MKELPARVRMDLEKAQGYRRKWQMFQEKSHNLHLKVIRDLHERGWSFRDMAPQLGISAQRIGQLFKGGRS